MKKWIIPIIIVLLIGTGYVVYNIVQQNKESKQHLLALQAQIEELNAQPSGLQMTGVIDEVIVEVTPETIVDTGERQQETTNPVVAVDTAISTTVADQFIQKLRNESISVDFSSICPYAKNKLAQYIQQPDKYLIVYETQKDEYGNSRTNKSWDYASVYDISDKNKIQSVLHGQEQLLATQPLSMQEMLPGTLGYSIKVNNSNYFWIETWGDEKRQYQVTQNIILTDITNRPKTILSIETIYNTCEDQEFYGDVAGFDHLIVNNSYRTLAVITNNYTLKSRRDLLNNIIYQQDILKIKDTPYGSIVMIDGHFEQTSRRIAYVTIINNKVVMIPINFAGDISDEGRLLGSIRKKDGNYPRLMQPIVCEGYECDAQRESIKQYIQSLVNGNKQSPYFDALVDSFERAITDLY